MEIRNDCGNRSQVQGSTFSAASDRRSGQFDRKRDSSVAESDTRVRDKEKLKTLSPRKKCWFCQIIAKHYVPDSPVMYGTGTSQEAGNGGQVCGDVEAVGFPVQNVYKMTYGDENATFEPLNPWPRPIIGNIHAKSTV